MKSSTLALTMMPSSPLHAAVSTNAVVIRQGIALLAVLGEERYTPRISLCYIASVGQHIRHIIEHYQSFLRGLDQDEIDYEDRARDARIESDPAHAALIMAGIIEQLQGLVVPHTNRGLNYCSETSEGIATGTSVLRELEFLLTHTIHHYALIAVMARLQGCEPEAEFGIAPSTLKFQRSRVICAP
jgi:hypothetical protein